MSDQPDRPCIYHITHVDNLPSILADGGLSSDSSIISRGGPAASIGMGSIKRRRLGLPVRGHPGTHVGEYVPFYFCPRSVMLYVIHCRNHQELTYRGGQEPILHLEMDLYATVNWADEEGHRWAFSLSNAGKDYTLFRKQLSQLGEVDWSAVKATNFRDPDVREGKQAEFLMFDNCPWHLVRRIGVCSPAIRNQVIRLLSGSIHPPVVEVHRDWYY